MAPAGRHAGVRVAAPGADRAARRARRPRQLCVPRTGCRPPAAARCGARAEAPPALTWRGRSAGPAPTSCPPSAPGAAPRQKSWPRRGQRSRRGRRRSRCAPPRAAAPTAPAPCVTARAWPAARGPAGGAGRGPPVGAAEAQRRRPCKMPAVLPACARPTRCLASRVAKSGWPSMAATSSVSSGEAASSLMTWASAADWCLGQAGQRSVGWAAARRRCRSPAAPQPPAPGRPAGAPAQSRRARRHGHALVPLQQRGDGAQ